MNYTIFAVKMTFSTIDRKKKCVTLTKNQWDLVIIGGGITGAGIALDAASRGMKVALLEMQDFAAGTSSRSTKLIHGGLRYLKQFQVKLVAEVGKERGIVYENGPHVTTPERMLLPIYKDSKLGKKATSFAISFYDFLAGVKKEERKEVLSKEQTLKLIPFLKQEGLVGSVRYVEYRTDDARLTLEVMKKANHLGAVSMNYVMVNEFLYKKGKVVGVIAKDQLNGEELVVKGSVIVNATGPWSDLVRDKEEKSKDGKYLVRTKGVHIVIDKEKLPLKQAIYYDTPDGRMIFAIPRGSKVYIGTTETLYENEVENPFMLEEDLAYIINATKYIFPNILISGQDVESSWAGLRPLIHERGKSASQISRKDEIWESDSGLLTIAGGKLTGYRKMGEHIVTLVGKKLGKNNGKCKTKSITISGGDVGGGKRFEDFVRRHILILQEHGVSEEIAEKLVRLYGSNIETILKEITMYKRASKEQNLPIELVITVLYGIKHEMMATPSDYFLRRVSTILFDISSYKENKERVVNYMKYVLAWNEEQTALFKEELEKQVEFATSALR